MSPTGTVEPAPTQQKEGWSKPAENAIGSFGGVAQSFTDSTRKDIGKLLDSKTIPTKAGEALNSTGNFISGATQNVSLATLPSQAINAASHVKDGVVAAAPVAGQVVTSLASDGANFVTNPETYVNAGKTLESAGKVAYGLGESIVTSVDPVKIANAAPAVVTAAFGSAWSFLRGLGADLLPQVFSAETGAGIMGILKSIGNVIYDVALKPFIEDSGLLTLISAAQTYLSGDKKKAGELLKEAITKFGHSVGVLDITDGIQKLGRGDGWGAWDIAVGIGRLALLVVGVGAATRCITAQVCGLQARFCPKIAEMATKELSNAVGKGMVKHLGTAATRENLMAVGRGAAIELREFTEGKIVEYAKTHGKDFLSNTKLRAEIMELIEGRAAQLGERSVDKIFLDALKAQKGTGWFKGKLFQAKDGILNQIRVRGGYPGRKIADYFQKSQDDHISKFLQRAYKKEIKDFSKLSNKQIVEEYLSHIKDPKQATDIARHMRYKSKIIKIKGPKCKEYYDVIEKADESFAEDLLSRGLRDGFNNAWDDQLKQMQSKLDKDGIKIGDDVLDEMKVKGKQGYEKGVKNRVKELFKRAFRRPKHKKFRASKPKEDKKPKKVEEEVKDPEVVRAEEETKKIEEGRKKVDDALTMHSDYGTAYKGKGVDWDGIDRSNRTHQRDVAAREQHIQEDAASRVAKEAHTAQHKVGEDEVQTIAGATLPKGLRPVGRGKIGLDQPEEMFTPPKLKTKTPGQAAEREKVVA